MNEIDTIWTGIRKEVYENALIELSEILNEIAQKMHEQNGNSSIRFMERRLKNPSSIAEKLARKGKKQDVETAIKCINDLAGLRIICFDVKQVYEIVDAIKKVEKVKVIKEKDYIKNPKDNGYQSYHLILEFQGIKIELQIRTILMDAWSSIETILIYKKSTPIPTQIRENIKTFSKLSKKMDLIAQNMLERKNKE